MPMKKLVGLVTALSLAAVSGADGQTGVYRPSGGFTQVVTTMDRGVKTIFISGQVGRGDDLRAHVESAFQGVVRRLEQAGATVEDVVKDPDLRKGLRAGPVRCHPRDPSRDVPRGHWPTSTMIGVQALASDALRVEIEAIAVVAEDGVDLEIERLGPSRGFSGSVAVTAHGVKTIYVAGHFGRGDDFPAQVASVWERVGSRLEAAGASLSDIVKATTYVVDLDPETDLAAYREGRSQALGMTDLPASTLVGIPTLVNASLKIEVDAIAVVGADGQSVEREFIDPAGGFTQVVTTRGTGAKVLQLSGQVGRPGDSLEQQADQVFANLKRRLEAAGASPDDLLKIVIYMPNYSQGDGRVLRAAREKHGFPADKLPASTLLGIQSLYSSEALLEIEGIAVVAR